LTNAVKNIKDQLQSKVDLLGLHERRLEQAKSAIDAEIGNLVQVGQCMHDGASTRRLALMNGMVLILE
jgi:hypothetical protein